MTGFRKFGNRITLPSTVVVVCGVVSFDFMYNGFLRLGWLAAVQLVTNPSLLLLACTQREHHADTVVDEFRNAMVDRVGRYRLD